MPLPRGTVTFMFTDIERSTELLNRLGDEYPGVLAAHRASLRGAIGAGGGTEVDARGDEHFAVFPDARAAVDAAARAQPEAIGGVRIPIGFHTGTATRAD